MISRDVKGSNKYTVSKFNNGIRYETGIIDSENRVAIKNAEKMSKKNQFFKSGYNGTPIIETMYDFEKKFPKLKFEDTSLLYDQMITDARTLPIITQIADKVSDDYLTKFMVNLNNIYQNSPKFFNDNFINSTVGFEKYQQYYYLLCFINYIEEHGEDENIKRMNNIDKVKSWVATRRDPNISYIIVGPTDNTPFNINYEEHYNTLMSSSSSMEQITQYQQLTTAQTTSMDVLNILKFIMSNPNVYVKTPDEAKKYTINIDSSKGVLVEVDKNNNLIFDCGYINLGDSTEQNMTAEFNNLDNVEISGDEDSKIPTKKLEKIFNMYSRVKILDFVVAPDTFITSLDVFSKVFLVFQGVTCSERNVYNTVENSDFKIGGSFVRTSRGYEFKQDVNAITYKSTRTKVKSFRLFLSINPSEENIIVPNEYALHFTKDKIYQHPVLTNQPYSKSSTMSKVKLPETYRENEHKLIKPSFNPDNNITKSVFNSKNTENNISVIDVNNFFSEISDNTFNVNVADSDEVTEKLEKINNVLTLITKILNFTKTLLSNENISNPIISQLCVILETFINDLKKYHSVISMEIILPDDEAMTFPQEMETKIKNFTPSTCRNIIILASGKVQPLWSYSILENVSDSELNNIEESLSVAFTTYYSDDVILNNFNNILNELISNMRDNNITIDKYKNLFNDLLDSTDINMSKTLEVLTNKQKLWNICYSTLVGLIKVSSETFNKSNNEVVSTYVTTSIAEINNSNGTINGKYFRVNNLFPEFKDSSGNPYTSPDDYYLIYSVDENDLCLYNLYSYVAEEIKNVSFGSFIYSENLGMIENLSYVLERYEKINNKIKFNNTYSIVNPFDDTSSVIHIIPEWKGKQENQMKWSELRDKYKNNSNITYYKINTRSTIDTSGHESNQYLAINNETKVVQYIPDGNTPISDDGTLLDSIFNDGNLFITDNMYNDDEITSIIKIYKTKYNSYDELNMYFEYYDKYSFYSHESSEWSTEVIMTAHIDHDIDIQSLDEFTLNILIDTNILPTMLSIDESYSAKIIGQEKEYSFTGLLLVESKSLTEKGTTGTGKLFGIVQTDTNVFQIIQALITFNFVGYAADNGMITINSFDNITVDDKIYPVISSSAYGPLSSLKITDYFGNYISFIVENDNNLKLEISNSVGNHIDEMTDIIIEGYDSQNNHIIVTYNKVKEQQSKDDYIIIENKKEVVGEEISVNYSTLLINITHLSLIIIGDKFGTIENNELIISPTEISNIVEYIDTMSVKNEGDNKSQLVSVINKNFMTKLQTFSTELNPDLSNCFNAYKISGIDVKTTYWNKLMYINSLMHCHLPISYNNYVLPVDSITYDTNNQGTILYTIDKNNVITQISGTYIIDKKDIYKKTTNITTPSGLDTIYAYISSLDTYFMDVSLSTNKDANIINIREGTIDRKYILRELILVDDEYTERFLVKLYVIDGVISKLTLYDINGFYDDKGGIYPGNPAVPLGEYSMGIYSETPIYIGDVELIMSFTYEETILIKRYTISSISVSKFNNVTYQYTKIRNDLNSKEYTVHQRVVPTIKYTNNPGKYLDINNEFFTLNISEYEMFKYHPTVKYIEKSFVKPKQIDKYGKYITVANKYNQNLVTSNVYLRNQYKFGNDSISNVYDENRANKDSKETLSIANKINPDVDHIVESLDKNLILIGNMNKIGSMSDLAISSENIYLVPQSSKVILTLEFS